MLWADDNPPLLNNYFSSLVQPKSLGKRLSRHNMKKIRENHRWTPPIALGNNSSRCPNGRAVVGCRKVTTTSSRNQHEETGESA